MLPARQSFTWLKIILGALLVYVSLKLVLFPQSRTLQAANLGEEIGMFIVDAAMTILGGWLLISGIRAGLRNPPFSD